MSVSAHDIFPFVESFLNFWDYLVKGNSGDKKKYINKEIFEVKQ